TIEKARRMLSFSPTHSVAQGLSEAMNWYVSRSRALTPEVATSIRHTASTTANNPVPTKTARTLATS
ncbi:MAG: hypothetical protein ACJ8AB_01515, partial [Gemmatimonadaceae bacterium]